MAQIFLKTPILAQIGANFLILLHTFRHLKIDMKNRQKPVISTVSSGISTFVFSLWPQTVHRTWEWDCLTDVLLTCNPSNGTLQPKTKS